MIWEVCIRYSDDTEQIVRTYQRRELALRYVDALYKLEGYPMHCAYIVRQRTRQVRKPA
jgi:hypothetical protein